MNTTPRALIKAALRSIGDLGWGRDAGPSKITDALFALNRMIDEWNIDPLAIFTPSIAVYTLAPSKQVYSIGPAAAPPAVQPDFNAPRPERIEAANLVMTQTTPALRKSIHILTMLQWANIRLLGVQSAIPTQLYYEPAYPLANIHLWPYPNQSFGLELYSWLGISEFATADDAVVLPPGYANCIALNLAVALSAEWSAPLRPDVASRAATALAAVRNHNSPTLIAHCDSIGLDEMGSNFDWRTGEVL
jgi:hypothetical protein